MCMCVCMRLNIVLRAHSSVCIRACISVQYVCVCVRGGVGQLKVSQGEA